MKVKLVKDDLQNNQLSWKCIEPMLLAVRGKDFPTKAEMYDRLNEGQKGLYLFYSFHNHASTIAEFYWFSTYYITEIKSWSGIKSGLRYYKDNEMVDLLDQIERYIQKRNEDKNSNSKVSPTDLDADKELLNEIKAYFDKYKELSKITINRMNTWINNNESDYIEITRSQ